MSAIGTFRTSHLHRYQGKADVTRTGRYVAADPRRTLKDGKMYKNTLH